MLFPALRGACARYGILCLRAFCLGALVFGGMATSYAAKWEAVDPRELADKAPLVDPEAGAEILYRELTVKHTMVDEFVRHHHVRAKIYSERGLEHFAKVDLPYETDSFIRDISVRTIKPDGEVVELTKKDIFDREILKTGRERVRVKSFSPAGLQPGAIVEYRYTEVTEGWSWYVMMSFQSDLPARHVRLKFHALAEPPYLPTGRLRAQALYFNCPQQPFEADRDGFYPFEMRNVAAAKDEPFQPPVLHTQSSILICYSIQKTLEPKEHWARHGRELHERMLRETKPTKQVRATLASIIGAEDSNDQKLRKIYDYCRTRLVNRYSDAAKFTREERAKFKANDNASVTLKLGHGSGEEINVAFVALARAAGFDARFASANDRSTIIFQHDITEPFMVGDLIAAVRLNEEWWYFDPGVRYLPFATPHWQNTATMAIVAAPKDAEPTPVNVSPPEFSQEVRNGDFELEPDGTLVGRVTIDYMGHRDYRMKVVLDEKTTAERETYIREEVQEHLKLAEVTDIKVENADHPTLPAKVSFHLRVPAYADRTGSRLFFQPAVFQKDVPQLFVEEKRQSAIIFRYCFAEGDSIRIKLPEGFELEQASAPAELDLGALGSYAATIRLTKDAKILYSRSFELGTPSILVRGYPAVRKAFELIHQRDAHMLTLRRKDPPAAAPEPLAPPAQSVSATQ